MRAMVLCGGSVATGDVAGTYGVCPVRLTLRSAAGAALLRR